MDFTGLNLSLDRLKNAQQRNSGNSDDANEKVLNLPVDKIIPDPDQPRKEFDDASIQELADDIKRHGLIQPIIVRKNAVGQYVVITGERRLRAFQRLKEPHIQAIVREYSADQLGYVQVAENIKRSDLKFYELAEFINSKVQAGEKQVEVADKLGISKATLNLYLSWAEAPDFLKEAKDKFSSIRAFSELVNLSNDYKEKVEEFLLNSDERISRAQVEAFKKSLTNPEPEPDVMQVDETGASVSNNETASTGDDDAISTTEEAENNFEAHSDSSGNDFSISTDDSSSDFSLSGTEDGSFSSDNDDNETDVNADNSNSDFSVSDDRDFSSDNDEDSSNNAIDDEGKIAEEEIGEISDDNSEKIRKPLIIGSVEGREAILLYKKRPSTDGMICVKYEDGFEDEILAERYRINRITDE